MNNKKLLLMVLCNAVFAAYILHNTLHFNNFIISVLVNLIIFIVPGVAWVGILRNRVKDRILLVFFTVCFSLIILTLGLLGQHLLGVEPMPIYSVIYLIIVTNIGIICSKPSNTLLFLIEDKKRIVFVSVISLLVYGLAYFGAVSVPHLEDFDGEAFSLSYSLIYELKPRQTGEIFPETFYFDHPPLTKLYSAYGTFFSGKIKEFKPYYDSAKATEKVLNSTPDSKFSISLMSQNNKAIDIEITNINDNEYVVKENSLPESKPRILLKDELIEYLVKIPMGGAQYKYSLFEGRMPSLFINVLVFWVFYQIVLNLTCSRVLALLAGFLYVASPGIFIRTCTPGGVALTNYALIIIAYQYTFYNDKGPYRYPMSLLMIVPGIFAAFVNQKILILIIAIFFLNSIIWIKNGPQKKSFGKYVVMDKLMLGYILGMILFGIYGYLISKECYFYYYVRVHLLNRILHIDTMYSGYPSVWGLWKEFNIEFLVLIPAIFSAFLLLKKYIAERRGIFIYWVFIGAISFSLVDWRQTRHLMGIVPPLIILFMMFTSTQKKWRRGALISIVIVAIAYSLLFDAGLVNNFALYNPSPDW